MWKLARLAAGRATGANKNFFSRNEENRGDKRIGGTGRVSLMRQPPAFGLARIFEMTPERLLNIMRNSIKSVVSALLTAGERPTMRIVAQACAEAGISPPANEASLAAMVSLLRRELGLSAIRTRREPTPAVVEDHHDHHEHDHEEAQGQTRLFPQRPVRRVQPAAPDDRFHRPAQRQQEPALPPGRRL